jgi:tetratricopeptide (TPR) repeat protein
MTWTRAFPTFVLVGAFLFVVTGCASAMGPILPPSPAEVPALEDRVRQVPGDASAQLRLGVAYLEMGRTDEARRALETAAMRAPESDVVRFYLGLAYEALERWSDALAAMEAVAAESEVQALRDPALLRLPLLRRQVVAAEIRASVGNEAILASRPPLASSVAVYPFRFRGADPGLAPLGTALGALVAGDLARVERVTVMERLRVQLLLDELRLAEEGYVDPATAARTGRLLGAERVVQGTLEGGADRMEVLAGVVRVGTTEEPASIADGDALDNFFDLQKRVVLSMFASMGIQLTPAERDRVLERSTRSLQALLLYGRALEAEDRGDWATAARLFQEAAEEDPAFEEARSGQARTRSLVTAATEPLQRLAQGAHPSLPPPSGPGAPNVDLGGLREMIPVPGARDPLAELLGREGLRPAPSIIDILLRPTGGEE